MYPRMTVFPDKALSRFLSWLALKSTSKFHTIHHFIQNTQFVVALKIIWRKSFLYPCTI